MSLQSQINTLRNTAHELLYLGVDDTPIYADRFRQLNMDVYRQAEALFTIHGSDVEEEASLCVALLMGYNATIYNNGDKEEKIQAVLDRSREVLDCLSASLLKCELLVTCYGEVFDEDLAQEAHVIMDTWRGREITEEEKMTINRLMNLEENQYPWNEVE